MKIGIDLGGTKIEGAVLEDCGEIVTRKRVANPNDSYKGILQTIITLVDSWEEQVERSCSGGIGTPGSIVQATGRVKNSNCLLLNGQCLEADMGTMLSPNVRVANDATALL